MDHKRGSPALPSGQLRAAIGAAPLAAPTPFGAATLAARSCHPGSPARNRGCPAGSPAAAPLCKKFTNISQK